MGKKYTLITVCKESFHRDIPPKYSYSIKALRDIKDTNGKVIVRKGDIGGTVDGEHNLSQDGECWIFENCIVEGNAKVKDNATIHYFSRIYGNAEIKGNASISGSQVKDNAIVCGNAGVSSSSVYGNAKVYGNCYISSGAVVCGNAEVGEHSCIDLGAYIESTQDYLTVFPIGKSKEPDQLTFYKNENGYINVSDGFLAMGIQEFEKMRKDKGKGYIRDYKLALLLAEYKIFGCNVFGTFDILNPLKDIDIDVVQELNNEILNLKE